MIEHGVVVTRDSSLLRTEESEGTARSDSAAFLIESETCAEGGGGIVKCRCGGGGGGGEICGRGSGRGRRGGGGRGGRRGRRGR